jgi:ABC-2 type transport system ATP-binding protein
MSETIIEMHKLSKWFGRTCALDNVSIEIQSGRIIGLLGANGSGKTTLLRHVTGLYLPTSGSCQTFSTEARELSSQQLAQIGCVHQEGQLLEWMNGRQLINYVAAFYPTWNRELEERFIEEFEVPLDKRVGTLSTGQKQQLAILLAIGYEPRLLLLDEPASALDPIARGRFLDMLLAMIQNQDRTIIISSHILGDVEKVIDHTIILKRGRIVCDAAMDELRDEYRRFTVESLSGELPRELGFANVIECRRNHTTAIVTVSKAASVDVEATSRRLNASITPQTLSLEDLYKAVVGTRAERQ